MSHKLIANAISAVLTLGLAGTCSYASAATTDAANMTAPDKEMMEMGQVKGMEKCYGIAKAGMNDCSTDTHHCAGEAKMDGHKKEWLLVPTGLCKRIVNGSTEKSA